MQKLKEKFYFIKQKLKNNSNFIKSNSIIFIGILFIVYLSFLLISINSWSIFILLSLLILLVNIIKVITYKELEIKEYFISDKAIYDRVNKQKMLDKIRGSCSFIFNLYLIGILTYKFFIDYDVRLFDSVPFIFISITLILIISLILNTFIKSYVFEYDFTIDFTFVKSKYRRRVWIYLRNRSEVLKRIANDEELFKIKEIKKQNSELVSFSELELVKNEIKKLTTKQLEYILFKDKLPVFKKNNILTKRVLLSVGAIVVFFSQEIKNLVLNIIKCLLQYISIDKIIQLLINMNRDVLFISVIIVFFYIIIPTYWLLKKIIIFFLNYRQTTIDDYLINMLEEELKNRKDIKHNFKNINRNLH